MKEFTLESVTDLIELAEECPGCRFTAVKARAEWEAVLNTLEDIAECPCTANRCREDLKCTR